MSGTIDVVKTIRKLLWHHGFRCLPVQNAKPGDKDSGKAPIGKQWTVGARQDPPECLQWEPVPHALNTGILCDGLRVIDVDVDDPGMAGAVRVLAVTMLGATIIRTRENSPRCLLVYRAVEGEPSKVAIKGASHSDVAPKVACKVEVLGKGQQFVAYGEHWTGVSLEWLDGGPANRNLADCPAVSDELVQRFLNAAGFVIGVVPIEVARPNVVPLKPRRAKANGHDTTALSGETFFAKVNELALTRLDDWVQAVFPQAVHQSGTAAWRVASKDRGRPDLEEDISLHPEGIQDFGLEVKLTAIDVVIAHAGAPDAMRAALWLCDHLGVAKESLGWKAREKGNGVYAPDVPPVGDLIPPPPPDDPGGEVADEEPPDDGPPEVPPAGDPVGPGNDPPLPVISCRAGELPRMVREAEEALLAAGAPIYQRSVLVRPAEQEYPAADGSTTHSAALVAITSAAMLGLLSRVAIWQKWDGRVRGGGGWVTCDPPLKVVEILLANRGEWTFPVVRGILTSPTLRPDGSLLTAPGYDEQSRYYLMFPTGLVLPEMPEAPTIADAIEAFERLNRLLDSYDFVEDGGVSRSVALALLMTQVLRCGMTVSPLLAVSATAPGSGKSHLVDLASTIAIGRPCPIMGAGKNEEETEKGLNTKLLSGVAGFSIDNVHRMVDNPILNIATERPMISIRLFGVLESIEVENSATIYMTGNNLPVVDEQVRRTVLCSLDAGVERPEQREFDVDPIATVLADRGRYIADILIIARAYLKHGSKPAGMKPFGSYPGWSKLVREPLIWLGQPDPVQSQDASRASDPEVGRLRSVMDAWLDAFGLDTPTTLADAVRFAFEPQPVFHGDPYDEVRNASLMVEHVAAWAKHTRLKDILAEAWGKGKDVDTGRWGYWMKRYAGRVVGGMMFQKGETSHSAVQWRLAKRGGRGG